ncbi:MAG: serine/threonine-protein kinase [Anaerolineae bacterium]
MSLSKDEMLQDRYRIVSLLGQGGMGAVYRAWDTRLNVSVALKEMTPQPGLDCDILAQLREQFQQEAQILARLNHPYLVRVGDFFQERGNAYLVMDFVEGESLVDRIKREGPLSEAQVLEWTGQLLDALAYCHAQGVVHRDVKPHNVIIRSDGRAVLVDFGLMKLWDPHDPRTKTAMRGMGTPEYAPPEQYDTKMGHTDVRSDIYSLGATIYHALTGQAPPTATLRMADPEQFLPLRQIMPAVSKRTEMVVMKSLELARSQRWQNTAEMAQALELPIPTWRGETATGQIAPAPTGRGGTLRLDRKAPPVKAGRGVPGWAWALGGLTVIVVIGLALGTVAVVLGLTNGFSISKPTSTAVTTELPVIPTEVKETATPSPSPSPTSLPTATATHSPLPTSTDTPTPTPRPTLTPTPRPAARTPTPANTPTPSCSIGLVGPEDGASFTTGHETYFYWAGAEPEEGGYYEVRVDGQSTGVARFNSGVQQWEATWQAQEGGHTWQVFLMAPDRHTVRCSSPIRQLNVTAGEPGPGPGPAPTNTPPTP